MERELLLIVLGFLFITIIGTLALLGTRTIIQGYVILSSSAYNTISANKYRRKTQRGKALSLGVFVILALEILLDWFVSQVSNDAYLQNCQRNERDDELINVDNTGIQKITDSIRTLLLLRTSFESNILIK